MAAMSGVLGKVALRRQMWRRPTVVRQVDIDREVHRLPNSDREDHTRCNTEVGVEVGPKIELCSPSRKRN